MFGASMDAYRQPHSRWRLASPFTSDQQCQPAKRLTGRDQAGTRSRLPEL